jgi:hypothetical protein
MFIRFEINFLYYRRCCLVRTRQNRVTWKTPSSASFIPLQEPVAVLAFLRSPHANAAMKQYQCGPTQPSFRAVHDRGKTCMLKPKGLVQMLIIIMKHKYKTIITAKQTHLKALKYLRQLNY